MNNRPHSQTFWQLGFRLALVEFSLRNEGSYLGNVWYLINPLLLFAVLYFVFVDRVGSEIENYPAYLILGILLYNFFSRTTLELTGIIKESGFIKSFTFPHEALVLSVVLKHVFAHLFEAVVFFVLLSFLQVPIFSILLYALVFSCLVVFIYGIGLVLASVTVYMIDIGNVWQFFTLLLLFFTPIFYLAEPGSWAQVANSFNPLYHFLTAARDLVMYQTIPARQTIAAILIFPVLAVIIGQFVFNHAKGTFAERI